VLAGETFAWDGNRPSGPVGQRAVPGGGRGAKPGVRLRPLGYDTAQKHLRALTEEAGLEPTGKTHMLRRTFGSLAASEGGGVPDLQAVMGHADPATTWDYTAPLVAGARRVTAAVGRRLGAAGHGSAGEKGTAKDAVAVAEPG
jgi:integrase